MNITEDADAQVRNVSNSKTVRTFLVAINDSYKTKQASERIEQTTYFDCAYWFSPKVAQIPQKVRVVELTGKSEQERGQAQRRKHTQV
jgi:single-strand DNA-binding protein